MLETASIEQEAIKQKLAKSGVGFQSSAVQRRGTTASRLPRPEPRNGRPVDPSESEAGEEREGGNSTDTSLVMLPYEEHRDYSSCTLM